MWETVDRSVHRVLELADDLKARGLGTSTGLLLVGPPGTGKTQLGTVVANELLGTTTVLVPGTYVTEHYLTELFDLAADLSPCLILMDDLDLIAGERGQTNPHRLREFLNVMDGGLADRSGVVVIASTNDHRKVDKAARRSSRFDTVIRMEPPNLDGRRAILERYLAWCDVELDVAAVARATDGATGADLKELVRATVLHTVDNVTTEALLAQAANGRWRASPSRATGQYRVVPALCAGTRRPGPARRTGSGPAHELGVEGEPGAVVGGLGLAVRVHVNERTGPDLEPGHVGIAAQVAAEGDRAGAVVDRDLHPAIGTGGDRVVDGDPDHSVVGDRTPLRLDGLPGAGHHLVATEDHVPVGRIGAGRELGQHAVGARSGQRDPRPPGAVLAEDRMQVPEVL